MNNKTTKKLIIFTSLLVLISLVAVACGSNNNANANNNANENHAEDDDHEHDELEGDYVRGGLMYDKWWVVVGVDVPEGDHPLWATQDTNTRSGADTWRCKECHGWDYMGVDGAYGDSSHTTGFIGINGLAGGDAGEALEALTGGSDPDHDFSGYMAEQDLIDLALFVSEGQIDYSTLVDGKASNGDAAAGETTYDDVCTDCHGPDGNAINFHPLDDPEFLGHLAPDNPWEFIHKVRFGQPGWPMPSAIVNEWTLDEVNNVLAYAQGFPTDTSFSGGGSLYDKWWVVAGADEPTEDHPLWATQDTNTRSGKDTWRCKECHGWDYLGVDGAYGDSSHTTGFTGVIGAADMSADEIRAWLNGENNPDHDFASLMGDAYVDALITFFQSELVDLSGSVNDDKSVDGDRARGQAKYEGTCAACHGLDGTKINFGGDDDPEYIGTVASSNPWETFHKILHGQPGEPMPSAIGLGWSLDDLLNVLSYIQTFPTE